MENMLDRNPRLRLGSVLYTDDGSGNLKSFNLLNGSDTFRTECEARSSYDYYLYTEDAKGSTVTVLDNAGSRVVSYLYDDFGDVTESKATGYRGFENELQYTGAVHDEMTGLLYLNARYYEPRTGRFITRDSYRGERENADTWHLYAYCANNPINYVDPTGHRKRTIKTWISTLAIDGILTIFAGWWKWSYDLVGKSIKKAFNKFGRKTASQKLLGAIPKVRGAYSRFYTKIRKAIWRATGYTIRIGSSAAITNGLTRLVKIFKSARADTVVYIVTSLTRLGGAISLALDYVSDRKVDGNITL